MKWGKEGAMAILSMIIVSLTVVALSIFVARLGLSLTLSVARGARGEVESQEMRVEGRKLV